MVTAPATRSCLYTCQVVHRRTTPKPHTFRYPLFLFYLDLAELPQLADTLPGFAHNAPGFYSFQDADHLPIPNLMDLPLIDRVRAFATRHGVTGIARVCLLAHCRVLGYGFNPLAVFYCFDAQDRPLCAIAQVENTFREIKPYFIPLADAADSPRPIFRASPLKHFYVSPFTELTQRLVFRLPVPGETLAVVANTVDAETGAPVLRAAMAGRRVALTAGSLWRATLQHPCVTVGVITHIHLHALRLWLKGVPFQTKEADPEWQRALLRPHRSLPASSLLMLPEDTVQDGPSLPAA